jgi:hypothetical protein
VHLTFSVATLPGTRKTRSFVLCWRKSNVISLKLEKFRRLIADCTPFYRPNAVHDNFSADTIPDARKSRSLVKCWRKSTAISLMLEIFRRLNGHFISFYTPNAVHLTFCVATIPGARNARSFVWFSRKSTVISLKLEILRRLTAQFTPFYTPNAVHDTFSVAAIPGNRKSRSFDLFGRNQL